MARDRWLLAGVLLLASALAWQARFVLDDAFISFQYARSWVEGQGLTWFGERVEGYTNFGWVVWVALADKVLLLPFLMTGLLGGFTTFSAFSLDTMRLLETGRAAVAFSYVGASVILSLAACLLGLWVAREVLA